MKEKINEEVSVVMYYNSKDRRVMPYLIGWRSSQYKVGKIGYHHTIKSGEVLHHIFELVDDQESLWFRLNLNTANLHWNLEAVHDGNPL